MINICTARLDYSVTPVTTGAYVPLPLTFEDGTSGTEIPVIISEIRVFDSSGQTIELAHGHTAAEGRVCIIPPGGDWIECRIDRDMQLFLKALSANATVGEININFIRK